MRKINNVALIGLGAIGASYGSRLHDVLGNRFKVVASQERIKKYQNKGITVNGDEYIFNYVTPEQETKYADLVIFAVKNAQLKEAVREIQHHIGPDTIILSLLNGISSEEVIANMTGNTHILPSMCVEITATKQDSAVKYANIGRICYGTTDENLMEDVLAVKALFEAANIPYDIPKNILHTIWAKFMFNVGINQTSAVLEAPYGVFQQIPSARTWMEEAMYEVVDLSRKAGIGLTEQDVDNYRAVLERVDPNGMTSMLQDILAGRKTEVEYFAGKVCELGEEYSVPTPVNKQLLNIVLLKEEMNRLKSSHISI